MTVPKRFGVLRLVGWVLKIIAWIELVGFIIAAILTALAATGSGLQQLSGVPLFQGLLAGILGSALGGVLAGLVVLLAGAVSFLFFYALGEVIHLQLALEENSRLTAALLLRMHQESQQETRSSYSAPAFESERFER
ncbi:MAG TPA: hypothetical protein PKE45_12490 [Caldilineaceae bacterium]|nr:hypothetical protein [Caldilineaceae bacterium]